MTPCVYRIDYVFERYFPQYWSERLCFRIDGWNHMVVGTKSGLLCYFTVNHYYGGTDADFDFFVHTGPKRKKAIMSDCVHIFLIGPQGSGKTTLLRQWVAGLVQDQRDARRPRARVAWEGLDESDADPAQFVSDLADAVKTRPTGAWAGRRVPSSPAVVPIRRTAWCRSSRTSTTLTG